MLECSLLLVGPWTTVREAPHLAGFFPPGVPLASRLRPVLEPRTQRVLGCILAEYQPSLVRQILGERRLRLFETQDASLVLSLIRPAGLFRRWLVFDSEEHKVGEFFQDTLFDPLGYRLAFHQGGQFFQAGSQRVLAQWESMQVGIQLGFASLSEVNPFLRMILLAWVVAGEN